MNPKRISVESFSPITMAEVVFGDLTVFVVGKNLLMQLLKAVKDEEDFRQGLRS